MKTIHIPEKSQFFSDWLSELDEAIRMASDGDTIVVNSQSKVGLAEAAIKRTGLTVTVKLVRDERDFRPTATGHIPLYQFTRTVACETGIHNYCDGCICNCHKEGDKNV